VKNLGPEREGTFRAPLGSASRGRIVLVGGASHLIVESDPAMNGLYRARFQEPVPDVRVEGSTVIVRYPRLRPIDGAASSTLMRSCWACGSPGGSSSEAASPGSPPT
jgi:hypothetical protein